MLLEGGEPCRCGNSGCLETLVSESAFLQQAENIAQANPDGILANIFHENTENSPIESVFEAARQGDTQVQEMIEERGYYLGVALANLINMFNPELILLGGIFSRGEDLFIEPVTRTIQQRAFGGMGKNVQVQATSFGWKAGVLGAAALALLHFFYLPLDE
jgi:predicted NBD/HSP70 family sugar kinase